jgi:uncharacterized protein (TIGR00730 family)
MAPTPDHIFPSADEDARAAECRVECPQTLSSAYRLAYRDSDFLMRDELRPVRLQLELLKPELVQQEHAITDTVVVFGSTRIPEPVEAERQRARAERRAAKDPASEALAREATVARRIAEKSRYYAECRRFAALIAARSREACGLELMITTGGGPGLMEAANRGASEAGAKTVGLNIVLPFEQRPNPFITPELSFQFHYFAIRKMHFLLRARALVVFPGGFGTLDELFDALTLIQTKKVTPMPILLFGKRFWERLIDFNFLVDEGTISPEDVEIFRYVETADEAFQQIADWYRPGG